MTDDDRPTVETRSDPAPEEVVAFVERAMDRGHLLTLFGRCTVDYDGRVKSELGPGDRLVVCKSDGAVLVHTAEGQRPINWQPPGSAHEPGIVGGRFCIRSERTAPVEALLVTFERVAHVSAFAASDPGTLSLVGTEDDLKRRILDDPDLVESGFRPLATERSTPVGVVDVYGTDVDGNPVVVELKRRRVGPDAVGQLDRYVRALQRDLHAGAEVRGILVAPSVTDRARRLLESSGHSFVPLSPEGPIEDGGRG